MSSWSPLVAQVAEEAGRKAGLEPTWPGFNGDAWIWIWRVGATADRIAEMQLRARPDPLDNAINFEVSSAAWLEPRREVAANRPIWAQFVSTDVLAEGRRRTFVETLAEQLREGVRHAGYLLDRLMDVQKSREATLASLRERKLLRE